MNTKKLLALYGLKWNPFSPELPGEGLFLTPRIEQFAWRVEQLVQEGGFALITGESGTGKSVALRIVAGRLAALRDVSVGVIERPQSRTADFYRELGDLFAVKLAPHNRWGGFKALRERWKAHMASSRIRPVLLVDEAQEMSPEVLCGAADSLQCRLRCHVAVDGGPLGRRPAAGPAAAGRPDAPGEPDSHAAGDRTRVARGAAGIAPPCPRPGRQRHADDGRADGDAGRSQRRQLPVADDHGRANSWPTAWRTT